MSTKATPVTNCPTCQSLLKPGAKFCSKCGKEVEAPAVIDTDFWHDDCGICDLFKKEAEKIGHIVERGLSEIFLEMLKDLGIDCSTNEIGLLDFEYKGLKFIGGFDDYECPSFYIGLKGGWKIMLGDEYQIAQYVSTSVSLTYQAMSIFSIPVEEADYCYFTIHVSVRGIYPDYIRNTLQGYLDDIVQASNEFQEDMTEELKGIHCSLSEYIRDYLNTQEGIETSIDDEGVLNFSLDEITYIVITDKMDDCEIFNIYCLNILEIYNPENIATLLFSGIAKTSTDASSFVSLDAASRCGFDTANVISCVKFFISEDNRFVHGYVQGLINLRNEIPIIFPAYFHCLNAGIEEFCQKIGDYK